MSGKSTTVRPPIIVVMGHVDHGKSTLLDYIRKSNTVAGEAGGITQHVAAYEAEHIGKDGKESRITFIDTPGHAAFKAIRARGANIADIAILVVAADDGVKAQTLEALESIRESGIPFIVAINKIDKPNADAEKTKMSLLEHEVYLEGLGGDVSYAPISAKSGEGIPDLLDLVLLAAELEEFTGNPNTPATGYVIEAHQDPKRGTAATLIITDGTLKAGQAVYAGDAVAPLRIMHDHTDATRKEATFSTPITVYGFDKLPAVGEPFSTYPTKKDAEKAREENKTKAAEKKVPTKDDEGAFVFPVVLKADTTGSLEALADQLHSLSSVEARVSIITEGVGPITEGDIKSAIATGGALVIGFNVDTDSTARELARQNDIKIQTFSIIYEFAEQVEKALQEQRPRQAVEKIIGQARVVKNFSKRKDVQVIGGIVKQGEIRKKALVRIKRNDMEIGTGEIVNLQAGKQNVEHIQSDSEFGAQVESVFEIAPNDTLECFVVEEQ